MVRGVSGISRKTLAQSREESLMKTRKMIVPRRIVKKHLPHPEYYGESIVELANGMVTDVYTNQEGFLYTQTNNEKLVQYLMKHEATDEETNIEFDQYTLKSIRMGDFDQIHEWFLISPFRRANSIENDASMVHEYISHAKTMVSDVFMASKQTTKVGLLGYTILEGVVFLRFDIYNHTITPMNEICQLMKDSIRFSQERFRISKVTLQVFEYDGFMVDAIEKSLVKHSNRKTVLVPTRSGNVLLYEYEIDL